MKGDETRIDMELKLTESSETLEIPDPEVTPKVQRRTFSASYKLDILRQAEACLKSGDMGRLLRREGLYSSHISAWKEQREAGALKELSKKRGRKTEPAAEVESRKRIAQLERDNERLRQKLEKAETIISVQKKLSQLLGLDEPKETR